jgi:V/A-type H+-transporting ATPase subunit A
VELTAGERQGAREGVVARVNGPLVDVDGFPAEVALFDEVRVGNAGLRGEVVAIGERTTRTQIYEYTGGLRPGDRVVWSGAPMSVPLGPGLLGRVFDGLLRALDDGPRWLRPGTIPTRRTATWGFEHRAEAGDTVASGATLGVVRESHAITHPVLVPPGIGGEVEWISTDGDLEETAPVARVAGTTLALRHSWPVRRPRPHGGRAVNSVPLVTGQRVLDLLAPVAKGSTAAVIGGFGTGKTLLLQQVAKWSDADVIVYVGCGERGNELSDAIEDLQQLTDPRTGRRLAERTVIIANTSNMSVMAREASVHTAMTVAEYYRDLGLDTVVVADSTSRWAEALREFGSRSGELPAEEGYPAGLASSLAAFYERAGRVQTLSGEDASVTVVAAVSPPGGDLTEPVSAHTQRFVRCLWPLDRDLAYARHYPAVSWHASFSRDADRLGVWHARNGDPGWAARRARLELLRTGRGGRIAGEGTNGAAGRPPDPIRPAAAERPEPERRILHSFQAARPRTGCAGCPRQMHGARRGRSAGDPHRARGLQLPGQGSRRSCI